MKQRFLASILLVAVWIVMISCAADRPFDSAPEEVLAPATAPVRSAAAVESASTSPQRMPKELRAAYIEARQREASEAYAARPEGAGVFWMDNPGVLFSTTLDREETVLSGEGSAWSLSVVTTSFGCEGAEQEVSGTEPQAEGNLVRYPRDGFEEWYLNGPLGLEQGFTLDRAPGCAGTKVIRWRVGGELEARLEDHDGDGRGEGVRFVDAEGRAEVRYVKLYVKDTAGKTLPAWMTVDKGEVVIHWEDAGAMYPVVVDPVFVTELAKLLPDDDLSVKRFATAVAMSGDTVLVGAYRDDDRGESAGAAYVFVHNGMTWIQQAKLTAADGAADDQFGISVAVSGDTVLVGAYNDDDKGENSGAAYVFVRTGAAWAQQAKITAGDGEPGDGFGGSVAVSGDTALVGAYNDDDKGENSGAAYVFVRTGAAWAQQAKITAGDGEAGDGFGGPVAVSGDTALVGAPIDDDNGLNSGSAYVFVRNGATWTQQAKLTATDGAASDFFSVSVTMSGDTALVGTFGDDKGLDSGSVYVFVRNGVTWTQQAKLTAADGAAGDHFGSAVAISGDSVLVGAWNDDDKGLDSGSAYVFVRNGVTWTQQAKLTATDGSASDFFGVSIAISGDTALIGAFGDDDKGLDSGSAYVLVGSGASWTQQAKLTADNEAADDRFGRFVALSGDTALVGVFNDDDRGLDAGAAYVFAYNGLTWVQQAKLTAADGAAEDFFGISVALSGDTAVVGAYGDDDKGSSSGAVYVFSRTGGSWTQQAKLTAADGAVADSFGVSVALAGDRVLVGAHEKDDQGTSSGAAYVFMRNGGTWNQQRKITASDGSEYLYFGYQVALSGDTALVGAYGAAENGANSGAAYVFVHDGVAWVQQAKLAAGDGAVEDRFGVSVALAGDTALVGAYSDDDKGMNAGSAYIFVRDGLTWTQQAKLTADDGAVDDFFGISVALSGDMALVGAQSDDDKGSGSGSIYFFTRSGLSWAQQAKLTASDGSAQDYFGSSVALSEIATEAIVGAPYHDDKGESSGSAYLFSLIRSTGLPCTSAAQCQSGFCVDGVCCTTPCNGICQACSAARQGAGDDGFCGPAAEGTDPHDTCTDSRTADPESCGTDGLCAAGGVCRVYADGIQCGPNECVGDTASHKTCNGLGDCTLDSSVAESCSPYTCAEGTCKTECAADSDCAETHMCRNGKCVPLTAVCLDEDTSQATDGTTTECSPYRCAQDTGACLQTCSSVDDCTSPNVCDETKTCVPSPASEGGAGCDCDISGKAPLRPALPVAFFAACLFALRRLQKTRRADQ